MTDGDEDARAGTSADEHAASESASDRGRPDVPEDPEAAVAADDHALPLEDLRYPEFSFDEGSVADDGSFDLAADLDREEMQAWLEDLAGGLVSHDVGVEAPDGRVVLGVAPAGVAASFDPDEDHAGEFEVSFRLRAKAMTVQDPEDPKVGARGGRGFVPLAMLTDDGDGDYRCYNWIDDPTRD